jgi:hypothetical protein
VNLFVYYKFKPSEFAHLRTDLQTLQKKVQQSFPDVQVRLLKRPEPDEAGNETWMESYEFEAEHLPAIRSKLADLVADLRLPDRRAFEVFIDI